LNPKVALNPTAFQGKKVPSPRAISASNDSAKKRGFGKIGEILHFDIKKTLSNETNLREDQSPCIDIFCRTGAACRSHFVIDFIHKNSAGLAINGAKPLYFQGRFLKSVIALI